MNDLCVTDLIKIKQLPVIEEQLRNAKAQVQAVTSEALSLACTPETIQTVKDTRSKLNKEFSELEAQRKEVKRAVMAPYEAFESVYKDCIADAYKAADNGLKHKIDDLETSIKATCEADVRADFAEMVAAAHLEWLTWDRLGVKIDLTEAKKKSHKKIHDQAAAFIDGVAEAVQAIATMDHSDEIMVEYRKSLSMSNAVGIVMDRHQRMEQEKKEAERRAAVQEAERVAVERVEDAAPILTPPRYVEPPKPVQAPKEYRSRFTVYGTVEQIRSVKEFLIAAGIRFEA